MRASGQQRMSRMQKRRNLIIGVLSTGAVGPVPPSIKEYAGEAAEVPWK
jgi:hypothetical protein